jgi:hypothetical protein
MSGFSDMGIAGYPILRGSIAKGGFAQSAQIAFLEPSF